MSASLVYLLLRQVLQMLTQLARDDGAKDVELLVLRHQVHRDPAPVVGTAALPQSDQRIAERTAQHGRVSDIREQTSGGVADLAPDRLAHTMILGRAPGACTLRGAFLADDHGPSTSQIIPDARHPLPKLAEQSGVRFAAVGVEPDAAGLQALSELVEAGRLRVHLQQTVPLEKLPDAYAVLAAGGVQGKLAISV